jgi:hypothetical protein
VASHAKGAHRSVDPQRLLAVDPNGGILDSHLFSVEISRVACESDRGRPAMGSEHDSDEQSEQLLERSDRQQLLVLDGVS